MTKIKFGTDGWRAIIAEDYTVENVKRVAAGTAIWMKANDAAQVVIGHDARFGGELFAHTTTRVMGAYGMKVKLAKGFVSTPMVSLGVVKTGSDLGVVITASHNPPSYNGFKLKSKLGGPMIPAQVAEVESHIPNTFDRDLPTLQEMEAQGLLEYVDLEQIYVDHVTDSFDLESIRNADFKIAYDAMYGAGQNALRRLLPDAVLLHCDYNPSFMGQAPEPIHRNLGELSALIKNDPSIGLGLANDGDADRIGMYDEDGNFVDSHHILLLLLLYMHEYKKQTGKVVVTFSVTEKMQELAKQFGLDIEEVYDRVGSFAYDRDDLHLTEAKKQSIIKQCQEGSLKAFGPYQVEHVEDIDGFKFYFGGSRWVMIRPSGTEPVLRVYAQAPEHDEVRQILDATHKALLG